MGDQRVGEEVQSAYGARVREHAVGLLGHGVGRH